MVRRRRARGFTMIELMIAMALASIGLLGLLALQVSANRGNAASRSYVEAIGVAQERIEAVQFTPYASLTTLAEGTCGQPITGGTAVTVSGSPTTYTRCTAVTLDGTGATAAVEVMVQWTESLNNASSTHYLRVDTTRSP